MSYKRICPVSFVSFVRPMCYSVADFLMFKVHPSLVKKELENSRPRSIGSHFRSLKYLIHNKQMCKNLSITRDRSFSRNRSYNFHIWPIHNSLPFCRVCVHGNGQGIIEQFNPLSVKVKINA